MSRNPAETGAFLTGKMSAEGFEALCRHRPAAQNRPTHITEADVIVAARRLGEETREAFRAWVDKAGQSTGYNL
jgi:hypothetical protein